MSEVKWIKLSTNMFEDEKIRLIENMPEADTILIIWVKLLAQAGKTNASGYIYLNENIPFTDEMLSTIFNRPLNVVRLALQTFQQFGMIDVTDNHFISISNWEKHQNIEGLNKIREQTRKRVKEHRERKKLELLEVNEEKCAYCGKEANTIDHIVPRSKGGKDIPPNIIKACKSCNSSKKDKDLAEFLNDSFFLLHQEVDHELVRNNEKLMSFVKYDKKDNRYSNVSVTDGNAIDIEKDKDIDKEKEINNIPFVEIVTYLNDAAKTSYRSSSKKTQTLIKARFNEGFTLEDFKTVIDNKTAEWLNNQDMNKYLRPETLFGTKFEAYLNQKEVKRTDAVNQYANLF